MTLGFAPAKHSASGPLSTKDRATIGLLVFYILIAVTLEAYWLLYHNSMEARTDWFAKIYSFYWPADRSYRIVGFGSAKAFALALESVNTLVTQPFNVLLIFAIVKRRYYRHVLQLTVSAYTAYGTFLYYYVAHINGYSVASGSGAYSFPMFYLANAPWFVGCVWLAGVSSWAIARQFRAAQLAT